MKDYVNRLDKLETDAAECEMIGNLASDPDKRRHFRNLALQYREMADAIREQIPKAKLA